MSRRMESGVLQLSTAGHRRGQGNSVWQPECFLSCLDADTEQVLYHSLMTTSALGCLHQARAKPLAPAEWQAMLRDAVPRSTAPDGSSHMERAIVLDVRNGYEWDAGHFSGAQRPPEVRSQPRMWAGRQVWGDQIMQEQALLQEQFNQTPVDEVPEALEGALKDAPILMYCTGGIRCDIYSTILRRKGYTNLFTLQGGVANYLREVGSEGWRGSLFTFDNRLAVAPAGM